MEDQENITPQPPEAAQKIMDALLVDGWRVAYVERKKWRHTERMVKAMRGTIGALEYKEYDIEFDGLPGYEARRDFPKIFPETPKPGAPR